MQDGFLRSTMLHILSLDRRILSNSNNRMDSNRIGLMNFLETKTCFPHEIKFLTIVDYTNSPLSNVISKQHTFIVFVSGIIRCTVS